MRHGRAAVLLGIQRGGGGGGYFRLALCAAAELLSIAATRSSRRQQRARVTPGRMPSPVDLDELALLLVLRELDARSLAAMGAVSAALRPAVQRLSGEAVRQRVAGLPAPLPTPLRCEPALALLLVEETSAWLQSSAGAADLSLHSLLFFESKDTTTAFRWPWKSATSLVTPVDLSGAGSEACAAGGPLRMLRGSLRQHSPLVVLLALLGGAVTLHEAEAAAALEASPPPPQGGSGSDSPETAPQSPATRRARRLAHPSLLLTVAEALRGLVCAAVDARNASLSERLRPGTSAGSSAPPAAVGTPASASDALATAAKAAAVPPVAVALAMLESGVLPPLLRSAVALALAQGAPASTVLPAPGYPTLPLLEQIQDQMNSTLLLIASALDDAHAVLGALGGAGATLHPTLPSADVAGLVAAGGLLSSRMAQPTDGSLLGHIAPLIGFVAAAEGGRRAAQLLEQAGGSALPLLLLGLRAKGILPRAHSAAALALLCEAQPDAVAGAIGRADEAAQAADEAADGGVAAARGCRRRRGDEEAGWRLAGAGVCGSAATLLSLMKLIKPPCNERCAAPPQPARRIGHRPLRPSLAAAGARCARRSASLCCCPGCCPASG